VDNDVAGHRIADELLVPDPTVLILFGATGDLAHRLVLPALFRLAQQGLMPSDYRIVGNGRGDVSHEDFAARVQSSLSEFGPKPDEGPWDDFRAKLRFAGGGFDSTNPGSLLEVLADAEAELGGHPQRIFYLAVPPSAFESLTEGIGQHGLADASARIVYEKPFGTSKESFQRLDAVAHSVFDEDQIYRIDHFLGKEATQDVHVLRFANGLFCNAWDRGHIESVQIDVPETLDVGMRADFYEHTGAILDMIVTHLFQLAAEVAMEPPPTLDPAHLAAAREAVIGDFRKLNWDEVVVGQYEGYRDIKGVAPDSRTETFVAARLWIDNDRWRGVPFLLRTGKTMPISAQRISIIFRQPETGFGEAPPMGNVVYFELSGDGEIGLRLVTKEPGPVLKLGAARVSLPLGKAFHTPSLPAYSRLIHDVMMGDRSLFTRPDGLAHVWDVAGDLLETKPEPIPYPTGSWGPAAADALAAPMGWRLSSEGGDTDS
jgi:glucose-6-phosphate 1-dehydrogenase